MGEFRVALTFDAEHPSEPHGSPDGPERILRELVSAGIQAAFFVQGRWATAYPALARSMAAEGHLIGNHSHHHARFSLLSAEGARADIRLAEEAIVEVTGTDPRPWFRFPFGDGAEDDALADATGLLGYRSVGWSVDPRDWDASVGVERLVENIVAGAVGHGDGCVVLLHTWPAATSDAVRSAVRRLRAEGARFVSIGELPAVPRTVAVPA